MLESLQGPPSVEEDKLDGEDEALIRTIFHARTLESLACCFLLPGNFKLGNLVLEVHRGSTLFQGSREIVRSINDDDEFTRSTSRDTGTVGGSFKRRKVNEKAYDSPTDYLTTASAINRLNNKEDPRDGGRSRGKFLLKSSTVGASVMKKLPEASTARTPVAVMNHSSDEEKQQEEHIASIKVMGYSYCANNMTETKMIEEFDKMLM